MLNIDAALRVGRMMHAEGEYKSLPLDEAKLAKLCLNPAVFAVLWREGEEYLGGMLGLIAPHYFCDMLAAKDLALYVDFRARGGVIAVRLIREFEKWAQARGAKEVYLSQSTGVAIDMTRQFYERLGYRTVGCVTKKEI